MPEHRWGIGGKDPKNALILAKANRNFLLFLQGIVNFKALLCKLLCIPLHSTSMYTIIKTGNIIANIYKVT